jgi:putative ABC transport system permease protein
MFLNDFKYAIRNLKNKPGFAIIAILILALGIGANTALFSVLYSLLWRPLPYPDAEKLVIVWEWSRTSGNTQNVVNPANFFDWKAQNHVFTDMAGFVGSAANFNSDNQPEEIPIQLVTPNFFQVLKANPVLGRTFVPADERTEDRLLVISHGFWMRKFAGAKNIVGKKVFLNGRPSTIIGVMPHQFVWFVKHGQIVNKPPQLWVLYNIPPLDRQRRGRYLSVVARLKPNATVAQANANMTVIAKQLESQFHDFNANWGANVVPLREQLSGELRKPLWILAGAVAFVLLISCSNVANLLLTRAVGRRREIAVRAALGAGRSRIIRQLLTESVLLAFIGGIGGILLAIWGVTALTSLGFRAGIDFGNVEVSWTMLTFALGLSLATGLIFGLVPALNISRTDLNEQLKEGSRGTGGESARARNILVVTELAITLVLLTGAGLLIQSFWRLSSIDPGFNPKQVLSFRVLLTRTKYPEESQKVTFFRRLLDQFKTTPGVKSVGMVDILPFAGLPSATDFYISGKPKPLPGEEPVTLVFLADDGYFKTLQIPIKRGRLFTREETVERKRVVVINDALARTYFPGEDPIGMSITIFMRDENEPSEIIGIVRDIKHQTIQEVPQPAVYWPHPELASPYMNIVIRTAGDPLHFVPTAASIVQSLDREQPLADVRPLTDWVGDSTARARFSMTLLVVLATIALILALAGIYGVLSHTVAQRTQEMGIRMALGATAKDVFALILAQSSKLIALGVLIGFLVSYSITRLMRGMLYETSTSDPVIFSIVIAFLVTAALVACSLPSRKASRVDPLAALRYE